MPDPPGCLPGEVSGFTPEKPEVSVDFEFRPPWDHPEVTVLGLSSGGRPHSAYWTAGAIAKLGELEAKGVTWVGHNSLTTERVILERLTDRQIPLERMEDTMLLHYLCNADLCKGSAKDEDAEDSRGQGYMDLWSMSSLYTDLPVWKTCRGVRCEGPCWAHDKHGYNGIDALAVDIALP